MKNLWSLRKDVLTVTSLMSFLLLSILVSVLTSALSYSQEADKQCSITDREADLNFSLKDVSGADVLLSDYAGKVILLDFWATWCAPCRIEIPGFIELNDQYEDDGLVILGVSVDDTVIALEFYMEDMAMDYPVLMGAGRDDVKDSYGPLSGFPTSYLINRDGSICHQHIGFSPKEEFEQEIQAML